jgi:hypothetical protein
MRTLSKAEPPRYEVITTRSPVDTQMFVRVTRPHVLICGPVMQTYESAIKGSIEINPKAQLLLLSLPRFFYGGSRPSWN